METIFNQLGIEVSKTPINSSTETINLLYIPNTDNSVRWVWPTHCKQPLFLKFYNTHSFKTKCYALLMKIIFTLKLQRLFFKQIKMYVLNKAHNQYNFKLSQQWAIFTGTVGPNNKALLYFINNEQEASFIKIATTKNAKQLLHKEHEILNRLQHCNVSTFSFPQLLNNGSSSLQITDVSVNAKRTNTFTNYHANALIELNELTAIESPLIELENWKAVKNSITALQNNTDERMPKGLIRKLNMLSNTLNENNSIEVCQAHGDFTPWNTYKSQDGLAIYDWELSDMFKPLGFDAFHFIIQNGILVEHKSWKEIKNDIDTQLQNGLFNSISKFGNTDADKYLKLYMLYNVSYYLSVYAHQPVWHTQVYWLINVWNEAISQMLQEVKEPRELLIMDTFDFLLNKKYATIKFPNAQPDTLSLNSDIDMCVDKALNKQLYQYFSKHPLVHGVNRVSKSFMATQQVFLGNGNILSIDLIWQLKRKALQILNVNDLLKNGYINHFGVKMLDVYDNARYIGLFYTLNNAPIPSKYSYYEELFATANTPIDNQIYPCFVNEKVDNKNLFQYLKQQKANKWLYGVINKLNYVLDTLITMFLHKGYVMTFSGVDGAGKSTVIENIKQKVEKQLRRRVVILRHRPSLLPILSTYVYGKHQAEFNASNKLPRTGNNNSFFSSLFRFAYYYCDYVFGQFYIYTKYVFRGYVVIYDRYYYDFMNDSKRSNIVLPRFISKIGFWFIIKPKYNFFLYANADTILQRKKELDRETINTLTKNYLSQFESLNKKANTARYISINNENLNDTLKKVFVGITQQAA